MDTSEREYNLRQLRLMLGFIHEYQQESLTLRDLIRKLEALGDSLQKPSEPWLKMFQSAWGKLEDVYASMLDEGRTELDEVDLRLIDEGVSQLLSLIQHEIEKQEQVPS